MELKYSQVTLKPGRAERFFIPTAEVQSHIDEHLAAGWKLKHYNSASEVYTKLASKGGLLGVNNNTYAVASTLTHTFIWERESKSPEA